MTQRNDVIILLGRFAVQGEEPTSRERPVVSHVFPELFHRASRPDALHLHVHPRHHLHVRRAFASRITSAHCPQHPPHAVLPIGHPVFNLPQLHVRQDGLCAEHLAKYRYFLRADTLRHGHDYRHAGTR